MFTNSMSDCEVLLQVTQGMFGAHTFQIAILLADLAKRGYCKVAFRNPALSNIQHPRNYLDLHSQIACVACVCAIAFCCRVEADLLNAKKHADCLLKLALAPTPLADWRAL